MSRISCEVIKDLLPLYVDEICSKDSEKLVKEHLAECKECCLLAQRLETVDFDVQEGSQKEINYMKKLKSHIRRKELLSFGFLILLVILVVWLESHYPQMPLWTYYVMLPVLAGAFYVVFSDYTDSCQRTGWKTGMTAAGLGLMIYTIGLVLAVIRWAENGTYPFGLKAEQIGSFVNNQLVVILLLHAGNMTAAIFKSVKTGISGSLLQVVSITGCCMALTFSAWLGMLDTIERSIAGINMIIAVLLLEGTVLAIIFQILDRRKTDGGKSCL